MKESIRRGGSTKMVDYYVSKEKINDPQHIKDVSECQNSE